MIIQQDGLDTEITEVTLKTNSISIVLTALLALSLYKILSNAQRVDMKKVYAKYSLLYSSLWFFKFEKQLVTFNHCVGLTIVLQWETTVKRIFFLLVILPLKLPILTVLM